MTAARLRLLSGNELRLQQLTHNSTNSLLTGNEILSSEIMPGTLLYYSRSIFATTEIARIRELMEKRMNQFTDALNLNISEDLEIDPEDFIERVEKEEELLQAHQEDTDEYSDEDNYEEDDEQSIPGHLSMHM
ncbi:Uncharacterized protein APZ42_005746 [Daphnia magna]|uniref:Uncharacterized protein n=1 Tax=Daphnia magna TaxID=35525 RepID=A0A164GA11_9CRUS|nr:Uncharacterized protein APZ42_005746 [Daphnia magna]